MKIDIERLKDNPKKLQIIVDDEVWKELNYFFFGKRPDFPSDCETIEELEEAFNSLMLRSSKIYSYKRLGQQAMCSSQLGQALQKQGAPDGVITDVISSLEKLGYINDQAWIQSFIRRHASRNDGPKKILMKLQQKGIDREDAQNAVNDYYCENQQLGQIKRLMETRYKKYDLLDHKQKQKMISSLMQKGYSYQDISNCLS
jgi:regulatory protein